MQRFTDDEKYEIATELNIDLCDLENLTAAQAGKVGGILAAKRRKERKDTSN